MAIRHDMMAMFRTQLKSNFFTWSLKKKEIV